MADRISSSVVLTLVYYLASKNTEVWDNRLYKCQLLFPAFMDSARHQPAVLSGARGLRDAAMLAALGKPLSSWEMKEMKAPEFTNLWLRAHCVPL